MSGCDVGHCQCACCHGPTSVLHSPADYYRRVTLSVSMLVLPAASCAVTVKTFGPFLSAISLTLQLAVAVAVPEPPRSFDQVTCVTPTLSEAVPLSVASGVVPVANVAALVGAVIVTTGVVVDRKGVV